MQYSIDVVKPASGACRTRQHPCFNKIRHLVALGPIMVRKESNQSFAFEALALRSTKLTLLQSNSARISIEVNPFASSRINRA